MAGYFFDSSAIVKRYVVETGTNWVVGLYRNSSGDSFYAVTVALPEVISAFSRRLKTGSLGSAQTKKAKTRFRGSFQRKFFKIHIDEALAALAADLAEKHMLRGYDAVQLAAALTANSARLSIGTTQLIFVCADSELNKAAVAEGLKVENPNDHL